MSKHSDLFLKLDGSRQGAIKGESKADGKVGEIEILSWSWGMDSSVLASAQVKGKASCRNVEITKRFDMSSTAIMSALRTAEMLKSVVITVRDVYDSVAVDTLRITLKKAFIVGYDVTSAVDVAGRPAENITFSFKEIEINYVARTEKNSKGVAYTFMDEYN